MKDTPFNNLLRLLAPTITHIPLIVRYCIKERHYLHALVTFVIVRALFSLTINIGVPSVIMGVFGYIVGYIANYTWEWYYAKRGNRFDINDVLAGAWFGFISGCLI